MQNINLGWKFKKLPEMDINTMTVVTGVEPDGFEAVDLPHTWYRDGAGYQGTAIYKKTYASRRTAVSECFCISVRPTVSARSL